MSSKEKLLILAKLIVDTCSHDEIDMLCIGLLDANMKCKVSIKKSTRTIRNT